MQRLASLLAVSLAAATATAQFTVTIPNGTATTEGASSTAYPWGRGTAQIRVQYVYDSTHFTNQGVTTPIIVNQLRFRANGAAVTAGYTYGNATVQMSSAAVDYLAPSTTFASNHGANLATVYSGPVTVATPSGSTPNDWYVTIPVTPFLYDPSTGVDLCLDMTHDGVGPTGTAGPAHDCATTGSMTSRIYNLTNATSPTGSVQQNVGIVVELGYNPPAGLYAAFTANVTSGASPLAVQFTDQTFTSAPGGVIGWAWDFDGDNVTDSNLQNPSFVYQTCGTYNVTLTVADGTHTPSTLTRTAYITTDVVTPSFTSALIGPGVVQFTDTSVPTPTSWAWDLNGDNVVDSNAQNPQWVYAGACTFTNVTLTVNRLCRGPYSVSRTVGVSSSLETRRDGGTSIAAGGGNYIDVNIASPTGINICRMEMKTTAAANAAVTFNVFVTDGSYLGKETNLAAWRQIGTGATTGVANAADLEVVSFSPPIYIPSGTFGVHIQVQGGGPQYSTQTAATNYTNADLTITTGSSGVLGGTPILNRVWNGAFYYSTSATGQEAGYGFFGPGCAGSLGMTNLLHTSRPQLGQTLTVNMNNLPQSAAIMTTGFSRTAWAQGALPADLTVYGMPGCFGRVSPDAVVFLAGANNTATWTFSVSNDPVFIGLLMYNQAFVLDPLAGNPLGAVVSDAAALLIGN